MENCEYETLVYDIWSLIELHTQIKGQNFEQLGAIFGFLRKMNRNIHNRIAVYILNDTYGGR